MGMIPGTFIVIEAPASTDNKKTANQQGTVPENKEPETIQDRWIRKFKSYWQKLVSSFMLLFEYLHIRITVLAIPT